MPKLVRVTNSIVAGAGSSFMPYVRPAPRMVVGGPAPATRARMWRNELNGLIIDNDPDKRPADPDLELASSRSAAAQMHDIAAVGYCQAKEDQRVFSPQPGRCD
ncbi:hypothetical protein [Rhodopila sp.]|uniref:hypothetical protein n=1 Tax=Rhodopila sp. TaxID=2480087 RepID=UPI003D0FD27A